MAGVFDSKNFNAEVFGKYLETVPRVKQNAFLKAGVLRARTDLKSMLVDQTGGNYISVPMSGLIGGTALNYDGSTDITATNLGTFLQSMIVVGRAKAWTEKDFSYDMTGKDFMAEIGSQVANYWDDVDQDTILAELKGIFGVTDDSFSTKHTLDISSDTSAVVGATTLNNAIQKAAGGNKSVFTMAIMHSQIATNLENLNLVEYMKYTDERGIERDLGLATWNGRTVLIDDQAPTETVYTLTTDTAIVSGKTYYTRSGSAGSYVYTAVASPKVSDIGTYYEVTGTKYTTYLLGQNAFDYVDCGAKVPSEMWRDPKDDGGLDWLITRQRKVFAPRGFSFKTTNIVSPTAAQLETASNWGVVKNTDNTEFYNSQAIPFARIISLG